MRRAANFCLSAAKAVARAWRRCREHVEARTWCAPGLQTRSGGAGVQRQPVRHSSLPSALRHAEFYDCVLECEEGKADDEVATKKS